MSEMLSEKLVLLDVDDTCLDMRLASLTYYKACDDMGIASVDQLESAQNLAQKMGDSFFPYKHVSELPDVSHEDLDAIAAQFRKLAMDHGDNFLFPDVPPFLSKLSELEIPTILLTYGDYRWQKLKLDVSGLNILPHIVTNDKAKGKLIASWYDKESKVYKPRDVANRTFLPARLAVESVILFDDKPMSFYGLRPESSSGYFVRRSSQPRPSQTGTLPEGISMYTIQDFSGINLRNLQ
jgi:hypothetical protein